MKKLLLTSVILLLTFLSFGQVRERREQPLNAIYLAHTPWDMGFGLRGDIHFHPWIGMYTSASYGQGYLYKQSGLDKHVKLTIGGMIPYKDYMGNQHDFTIGLNYHWVSGEVDPSEVFRDNPLFHTPWSFELGFTIKMQRVTLAFRTDILRWEPGIDVGIPLKFGKNYRNRITCPSYE